MDQFRRLWEALELAVEARETVAFVDVSDLRFALTAMHEYGIGVSKKRTCRCLMFPLEHLYDEILCEELNSAVNHNLPGVYEDD